MTLAGAPRDDHPTVQFHMGDVPEPALEVPPPRRRIGALTAAIFVGATGLIILGLLGALALAGDPLAHGRIIIPTAALTVVAGLSITVLAAKRYVDRRVGVLAERVATLERALKLAEVRLEATLLTEGRQIRQELAAERAEMVELLSHLPDRMNEFADGKVTDARADAALAAHQATGTDGRRPRGVAAVTRLRPVEPN